MEDKRGNLLSKYMFEAVYQIVMAIFTDDYSQIISLLRRKKIGLI